PNAREPASDRILAPLSLLRVPPPPNSTLFPYTTLFRSQTVPIPLASGTYAGLTVPPDYNPNQINPYTGQPFGPPPPGVVVRPNNGYYQNAARWDAFSPRFSFAWQPGSKQGRLAVRSGYGWFYQPLSDRGNATGTPSEN